MMIIKRSSSLKLSTYDTMFLWLRVLSSYAYEIIAGVKKRKE
jgi:hypothetical protein